MKPKNIYLLSGGIISFSVAILHIAIIFGGEEWYRYFGAGEEMALMARSGSITPTLLTSVIVIIFAIWGFYAFSGAGIIRKFPLLRLVLVIISVIYIFRGLVGIPAIFLPDSKYFQDYSDSTSFILVTSLFSLTCGTLFAIGTMKTWSRISRRST
jgi:fatty acid desaturase